VEKMKNKIKIDDEKIDKDSVVPIYYQLAKIIENKILTQSIKPNEKLPPETKIADIFDISRMTVRKAISELVDAGMVYSEKGKGTFVSEPQLEDMTFELKDFHEEISKRGMKPRSRLLNVEMVRADDLLMKKLNISRNTKCLYFCLLISADNEPLIYENKYVVYRKQEPILESELKDSSLSDLASLNGEYPVMSKRILHASVTTEKEANILGVQTNTPVFVVEQILYSDEKKPVGWGRSVCRGDRFKFTSYKGWSMDSIT